MNLHFLAAICLGAASSALLSGADAAPSSTAATESVFVEPTSPEASEIVALGQSAISRIGTSLVSEVMSAIAKGGPEKAVEVCHLKALPLTGEVVAGMPRITAAKRTSLKLRNPANAPDEFEKRALERFQRKLEDGTPPALLVQRIDHPTGKPEWRVYRPVVILQQCVVCHGPADQQPPALRTILQERYPADAAVGYKLHDWRGLLRVTVGEAPPKPAPAAPKAAPIKGAKRK